MFFLYHFSYIVLVFINIFELNLVNFLFSEIEKLEMWPWLLAEKQCVKYMYFYIFYFHLCLFHSSNENGFMFLILVNNNKAASGF